MVAKDEQSLTNYKLLISTDGVPHKIDEPNVVSLDISEQVNQVLSQTGFDPIMLRDIVGIKEQAADQDYSTLYTVVTGTQFTSAMNKVRDLIRIAIVNKTQLEAVERQLNEIEFSTYNAQRALVAEE